MKTVQHESFGEVARIETLEDYHTVFLKVIQGKAGTVQMKLYQQFHSQYLKKMII